VSAIAFDPANTSVAYLAQDGGGIWKTTNCCTPFTTWTVTTDGASVSTTATDDVTVDPNNSNVVYAGLWNTRRPPWFTYAPLAAAAS
jgi:hypothetical protein